MRISTRGAGARRSGGRCRHRQRVLAIGAIQLMTSPEFIAGNVLATMGTGEFDVSHNRDGLRQFRIAACSAGKQAASVNEIYSTPAVPSQAKAQNTFEYILDPGRKNEFHRGEMSLRIQQTCFRQPIKFMKTINLALSGSLLCAALFAGVFGMALAGQAATPKKVLVVTTTTGFRHSSIPTAERILAQLAQTSGAFTVEYARVEPNDPQFKGPDGKPIAEKVNEAIKAVLAEKMSPAALKEYDAVIFANTTGDLPLPDKDAFIDWVKSGKGFVGMHAASDTFHHFAPYVEMLGAEFKKHEAQVEVEPINQDAQCPVCRHLPPTWKVYDEIYQFQNFDRSKVHGLLTLDKHPNNKTPGDYPISWCKEFGKGRVFYTSLGHREDVWDPNAPDRKNPKEVAEAYQKHILEGIKWAVGLESFNAKPE